MANTTFEIVKKKPYRAVGLKWDGPWSDIQQLKQVIQTMSERAGELEGRVEPNMQLGLSYHERPDGFTHYSAYEVTEEQPVPEGMIEKYIPELTYFVTNHEKGADIGETYYKISRWLLESEYKAYTEPNVVYFEDALPIKHEKYPHDRDLQNPHFEIWIPVVKK
ncbi:GyrI-like domain-containing protein [Evansella sp. LMS18]|jgi:predicted transcriptional regulator YdeE|uniref:GyrI-like domain-containing protein n=1 Tax=Evansella sp. LMS18 TaxID=2924033 RepID=UPI0020D1AF16|nr:GyrI-like domain-containing protein [Evansella sp. LMS18]UTR10306.1 GyrI-like domain-containing protein [Evansella sp. LMS18]